MPDYSLGKIYMVYPKVEDPDEGDVYYGSTTETLGRRMAKHRSKDDCSSKILFDKYGIKNCFIELVEEYPCETKEQLNRKEGEYIRANKCINKQIAGRTREEWLDDNSNKVKEYKKHHYVENIDKIKESKKQHYIKNRDKISEKNKQKEKCPQCNKEITKINMTRHIKSGYCHNPLPSVQITAPDLD